MLSRSRRATQKVSQANRSSANQKTRHLSRAPVMVWPAWDDPPDPPKGWKTLWLKAQKEKDPQKLIKLIDQLNALLTEREKNSAGEQAISPHVAPSRNI
jgi:hypothetical protein